MTDDLRDERVDRIAQYVRDLSDPFTDVQHLSAWDANKGVSRTTTRKLRHPSILDQLRAAADQQTGSAADDGSRRPIPESAAPPGVEALERLDIIAGDLRDWIGFLGHRPRTTIEDMLTQVVGIVTDPTITDVIVEELERDLLWCVRSAKVFAGWDHSSVYRPHAASCYVCGTRGKLAIRLDVATAVCTACEQTWDQGNITVLADHVAAQGTPVLPRHVGIPGQRAAADTPEQELA